MRKVILKDPLGIHEKEGNFCICMASQNNRIYIGKNNISLDIKNRLPIENITRQIVTKFFSRKILQNYANFSNLRN